MKQKILFTIGNYDTGGKERQLTEIIYNLDPKKFEVHLLVMSSNNNYQKKINNKLSGFYNAKWNNPKIIELIKGISYVKLIYSTIVKNNFDIIFCFSKPTAHISLAIKKTIGFKGKLINGSIREAPIKLTLKGRFERKMYSYYEYCVSNSYAGLKIYSQNGQPGRFVLYNGFDFNRVKGVNETRKGLKLPKDKFIVTMVGRHDPAKDYKTFIDAAEICIKELNLDIEFFSIGDGSLYQENIKYSNSKGLQTNLFFLGHKSNVESYINNSDLMVLTSTNGEGLSNVIMEAMALKKAVIATESPGTKELLINDKTGTLIKRGDFKTLAEKIKKFYIDKSTRKIMGDNAFIALEKNFSVNSMIENFYAIIEKIQNA
tara:strand:- start:804 stop:1922 length:1119 start_codon:yes stop_codon:yes gene_type:complete